MAFPGTTLLPLAFSGGLQSKVAKFSLDQPNLETAENCRYTVAGQIEKRTGLTSMSRNVLGGGYISAGAAIQVFGNELVLFDGSRVYSWRDSEDVWVPKGSAFSLTTGQTRVLNTKIATQSHPDAMTIGDLTLYVWEDDRAYPVSAEGARYSVVSSSEGNLVVSDVQLWPSALRPKVVAPGAFWMVAYEISASTIYVSMVQADRPNIVSAFVVLATDGLPSTPATQSIPYDLSVSGGATYFAYASATGLILEGLTPTYGAIATSFRSTVDASVTVTCVSVYSPKPGVVWVSWSDATTTRARCYDGAGNALTSAFVVQSQASANLSLGGSPAYTSAATLVCEVASTGGNYVNAYTVAIAGPQYIGQQRSVGLAAKVFTQGANVFATVVYPSSLQATYFTLCLTSPVAFGDNSVSGLTGASGFEVVAKHSPSNGGGLRTNALLSESGAYGTGTLFAGQRKGPFTSYANAQGVTLGCAGYSTGFASINAFNSVASNNNLHITGGVKKIYDGVSVVEDNFHVFPELLALPAGATFPASFAGNGCSAVLAAGGSLTASSSYLYVIVYSWADNFGQVQRSGPGVATVVTTAADANLTAVLTIPTLRLTDKTSARSPVTIDVYRTQANLPTLYKLTSDASPLANDITQDSVTYTDTVADSAIAANENLYTGTQLANTAPPGCSLVSLFQNRLVINQNEDPGVVWYSQNKFDLSQYNTLPLDWNTSFVEGVDSRGGANVTALGLLDASLAIFKPTAIYLLYGSGPNALDTDGEFADAQLLVSDTGCENQNSLAFVTQTPKSPGGLLFKSAKGIYLLGRDSSLTYVGDRVEAYNDMTITSANILAETNEIVFTTLEGTAIVYNYYFDAWTTWTGLPAVDAVVWQGALVLLKSDGTTMIQDLTGTVWQDTGSNGVVSQVTRTVTTPWVKLQAMQGYQATYSCTLLGQYRAPHTMTVGVSYDYNPSVVENVTWNGSLAGAHWGSLPIWGTPFGTWGDSTYSTYQFQINLANPRCQAVQLTFTDAADNTEGSVLNGLVFELLALPGPMRLPQQNLVASTPRTR